MKKFVYPFAILIIQLFHGGVGLAKNIPQQEAQQVAAMFYRLNYPTGLEVPQVRSVSAFTFNSDTTCYIVRFDPIGFVLVAADDASIPILGYSFENEMPETIDHPAVVAWLDDYSRQIRHIINSRLDNRETVKKWDAIKSGQRLFQMMEVLPLISTIWGQHCYYNEQCPADPAGPCGHVWTGCVATSMAQIMEYHQFPPQGVGQHTYTCPGYGQQTADFENTFYDWASMADSLTGSNPAVAMLMHHAGVAVDMEYGPTGSGADGSVTPWVLENYFNYSPGMEMIYLEDYPDQEEFKDMIREDLDADLPVLYIGVDTETWGIGHQLICDGYRMSDSTFHFNWGMGGLYNGYYLIGHLNASMYNFDYHNSALLHIKPYNPDLIVRIADPCNRALFHPDAAVEIMAKVVRGTAGIVKIFIDGFERASASGDSVFYSWGVENDDLGSHFIEAYACNSTDTVWHEQLLNVSEWIEQASGFPPNTTPLWDVSAVDSNVVWGSTQGSHEFTRTVDGGNTWTSGLITNAQGLGSSMIFGLSSATAYSAMMKISGSNQAGIYVTTNGGASWTRQATAYNHPASWADVVHFYNSNEGFTIGDPVYNEYEIYLTTNGGANWIQVPGGNIPDPLTGEYGIVDYYSVVQDTIWFGTNLGRVFRSVNRGQTWTVSSVPGMNDKIIKPAFRNGSHGLVMDGIWGSGKIFESFDGGITWAQVNYTGSNHHGDISYVPGTPNSWVRSDLYSGGSGSSYSFDGGHTWTDFPGTEEIPMYPMTWLDNHCGWAGGISKSATEGGVFKCTGWVIPKPAPENVQAIVSGNDVDIIWDPPVYDPLQITLQGYNIRRNGTKLNSALVTNLSYTDQNVPDGQYTYCITAQYNIGASEGACANVEIATGIISLPEISDALHIYPNPTSGRITIESAAEGHLTITDLNSQELMHQPISSQPVQMDLKNLPAGVYFLRFTSEKTVKVRKFIKK